jgi:hypothetical protein
MPADDPFLMAASIAVTCLALAALRSIVTARRGARAAAREAFDRYRRMHAEIEALRRARQKN